jgi:hypothetical protein
MKPGVVILLAGLALAAPGAVTYGWELLNPESCLDQQPKPELEFLLPGCEQPEFSVTASFPGRHPVQTGGAALGVCAILAGGVVVARRRPKERTP